MTNANYIAAKAALQFYYDHGVDECLQDEPVNRTIRVPDDLKTGNAQVEQSNHPIIQSSNHPPLGSNDARIEAIKLAKQAQTLDELREAIAGFDGIAIKKTASNLVFADGNPKAKIMLIGEGPGADEDRQGKPFVGTSGQLLDKILACIGLNRQSEDLESAVYLTNVLNWRPPGNRTPNPSEIAVSLPFVERHIQLIKPQILILCGGAAKALLGREDSFSKLRKNWHNYSPLTAELAENPPSIPAIATYHPTYLLSTPVQKKAVWADMLMTQAKMRELGIQK